MKALYSYFGRLNIHDIDSPGHSFYQLGLIDSIRENFGEDQFDFYSYYPDSLIPSFSMEYPETPLGKLFAQYYSVLIDKEISLQSVLEEINNRNYSKLFLKARFRNLSALAKKWKDARDFEQIISTAITAGYSKEEIIILDTDLSLPEHFYRKYADSVTISIPSIDFPGISTKFLNECVAIHNSNYLEDRGGAVFYGNIDTSKYKSGNEKDPILNLVLDRFAETERFTIICKLADFPYDTSVRHISRHRREMIWEALANSTVMINVTKSKYNTNRFIPARIFEAMIFGMIPISYQFNFLSPAFSFQTMEDLEEILKYIDECDIAGRLQCYNHFVTDYLKHVKSTFSK